MRAAGNGLDLKTLLMEQRSWKEMIFKIPSSPNQSVILTYLQNCWSKWGQTIQGDSDMGDFAVWCVLPSKKAGSSKEAQKIIGDLISKSQWEEFNHKSMA